MKVVLICLSTLVLILGAVQGLALGGAPGFGEPLVEGYLGGLAPVVFGALGAIGLFTAHSD